MILREPLTIFIPHCSDLLTDHRSHGDGLISHALISRLAARGHELYIAASRVDLQKPLPPNAHLFEFQSMGLDGFKSRVRYMKQVRALFRSLRAEGVKFHLIHQLNPVFTGLSLAFAGSALPVVLGPFFSRWPGDPTVLSSTKAWQAPLLEGARTLTAFLQQSLADCLLPTTDAAVAEIVLGRRCARRVEVLPVGIDSSIFCPGVERSERTVGDEIAKSVTILFLANVIRRKGIFDLLRAFDSVAVRCPEARLVIAGDGSEMGEAQRAVPAMIEQGKVLFVGRQDRAGAARLFQNCDIYCLPSHGEPYGMTAVEAMSCGKPLVVTDAGGLGCLLDDQGGLRVPVRDPERLADALCTLIADPGRRKAMGEHNRSRVLATMTWDRVIDRLEQIYVSTIQAKRRQPKEGSSPTRLAVSAQKDCA